MAPRLAALMAHHSALPTVGLSVHYSVMPTALPSVESWAEQSVSHWEPLSASHSGLPMGLTTAHLRADLMAALVLLTAPMKAQPTAPM